MSSSRRHCISNKVFDSFCPEEFAVQLPDMEVVLFSADHPAADLITDMFVRFPTWLARQSRLLVHDEIGLSIPEDSRENVSTAIRS